MRESQKLLSYGFRNFETKTLYRPGDTLQEQPIFYGTAESLPLGVAENVVLTFPKGYYQRHRGDDKCASLLRSTSQERR